MDKTKSIYAIYKYDFHKATEPSVHAKADGIDGAKYLKQAQRCFKSLFDQNTIDGLRKISHDGDNTLPNLKRDEDNWKVVLIEEEFTKRMFETE